MDGRYLTHIRAADKVSQVELAEAMEIDRMDLAYLEMNLSVGEDWLERYEEGVKKILAGRRRKRVSTSEKIRLRVQEDNAARAAKLAAKAAKKEG